MSLRVITTTIIFLSFSNPPPQGRILFFLGFLAMALGLAQIIASAGAIVPFVLAIIAVVAAIVANEVLLRKKPGSPYQLYTTVGLAGLLLILALAIIGVLSQAQAHATVM